MIPTRPTPVTEMVSHEALQQLVEAAAAVANGGDRSLLAAPLRKLNDLYRLRHSPRGRKVLARARDIYDREGDERIDIDERTLLYRPHEGAWCVMAWCFVRDEDL